MCLDGLVVYLCQPIIQRDKKVYGETADVFMPERWLGDADAPTARDGGLDVVDHGRAAGGSRGGGSSGIPASAWRPFERGPRNCIGQELANMEARVILASTARRF